MGREFNFPKFRAGEPLLPQLTAERLNAIVDAVGRNRIEFGDNVTGQRTPGGVIVRANAKGGDGGSDPDITFFLSDATTTEGDPPVVTRKVFIADGKINGEFPTGMGTSEYTLDLTAPEGSTIYAGVTFDPVTLVITSRFLGAAAFADMPESRVDEGGGFVYWQLGFTFVDVDDAFRIIMTRVGDINFELVYGGFNGKPALLPVDSGPGWIELPEPE